jgi:hypothetical protein
MSIATIYLKLLYVWSSIGWTHKLATYYLNIVYSQCEKIQLSNGISMDYINGLYQGTISRLWAIIVGLGKFQNSVYSTAFKGHNDSLYSKYFRKMWFGYQFPVSKDIFVTLKQVWMTRMDYIKFLAIHNWEWILTCWANAVTRMKINSSYEQGVWKQCILFIRPCFSLLLLLLLLLVLLFSVQKANATTRSLCLFRCQKDK